MDSLLDETPSIYILNLNSVDMKRTCEIGFFLLQYPNVLNQMQYLAKITIDKRVIFSDIGYILIDPKKNHITAINSGTFLFLLNYSLHDFD
jgi:hypothetical protein